MRIIYQKKIIEVVKPVVADESDLGEMSDDEEDNDDDDNNDDDNEGWKNGFKVDGKKHRLKHRHRVSDFTHNTFST